MADEEYERFEITDYDLQNEFNPNRHRKRASKQQQIYGIWADDSEEEEERVDRRGRRRPAKGAGQPDYTAPLNFVAGGIQQSGKNKEKAKSDISDEDDDIQPGGSGANRKASSSESESEGETNLRSLAGLRKINKQMTGGKGGIGAWEQHTKGIGAKLLLKMGYQPGKGLGKELQGISAPVQASLRKGRGAIGAYGPEHHASHKAQAAAEQPMADEAKEKPQQWKRGDGAGAGKDKKKVRYFYKSVEDVIEKGKKPGYSVHDRNSKMSQVTVIDMTGPEKRVLSGYHALGQAKVADEELYEHRPQKPCTNFQLPELMHNLNLIVDQCEQDIIVIDKKARTAEERVEVLEEEKDNLLKIVGLEKKYIDTLEGAMELVNRLVNADEDEMLELADAENIFIRLQAEYPAEYAEFELGDLAPGVIAPLISMQLKDWNALVSPDKYVDEIKRWQQILGAPQPQQQQHDTPNIFDPYSALVWTSVVPSFRSAAANWNPRVHEPMVTLLSTWSQLLPTWILDNVLEQIVLSKLVAAVADWDPLTDTIPIHIWIQPWCVLLNAKMNEQIYPTIRDKLAKALKAWGPEDRSARAMLTPWNGVFDDDDMLIFLMKNIVPKLEVRLAELVINPLQQDLEVFNQVWEWNELLTPVTVANIMEKYFFPKWIQTLVIWLNQSPNFDQVSRWYSGWKNLFSVEVLQQVNVNEQFRRALELMQRAIGNGTSMDAEMSLPPITPVAVPKPPSLLEMKITPPATMEFKELVSQKCAERGIIFAPMPGRREGGKQVYRVGKLFCYIDRAVCMISSDGGVNWAPISLTALLDKSLTG